VTQEEMSIILGGDSIGHCVKNSSYEYLSNSEWLQRQSCLNPQIQNIVNGNKER
jgi:hypothetical protein